MARRSPDRRMFLENLQPVSDQSGGSRSFERKLLLQEIAEPPEVPLRPVLKQYPPFSSKKRSASISVRSLQKD